MKSIEVAGDSYQVGRGLGEAAARMVLASANLDQALAVLSRRDRASSFYHDLGQSGPIWARLAVRGCCRWKRRPAYAWSITSRMLQCTLIV